MGPGIDRSTALQDRYLVGHQRPVSQGRLRGGEHIGKFTEDITQLLDVRGGPSTVM